MKSAKSRVYDLKVESEIVRQQQKAGPVDPIVEARNMVSQAILAKILLAMSDTGVYEYLADKVSFDTETVARELELDAKILDSLFEYLHGAQLLEFKNGSYSKTLKGKRYFNVYTRGVLNIYLGAYDEVLSSLEPLLKKKMKLDDPKLDRSTRHAAAGTAFATCVNTIPKVVELIKNYEFNCVLDLGCGTGDFLIQLCRENTKLRAIGVDMSTDALAQARDSSKQFDVDGRIQFKTATIGKEEIPLTSQEMKDVDLLTSMYMVHELGRDGRGAIIELIVKLKKQFSGKKLLLIEVEDFDPKLNSSEELAHYGRMDYRLIHILSRQGLPRPQMDWHGIFKDAGCAVVEPGVKAGGSFIYIIQL
jgi:SAM-dependent methyltransferase